MRGRVGAAAVAIALVAAACGDAGGCAEARELAGRMQTPRECSMREAFPEGFPHPPPAVTGGENRHDLVLVWEAATPLAEALDHYREALGAEPFDGPDGPTFEATVDGTEVVVVVERDGLDAVTVRVYRP